MPKPRRARWLLWSLCLWQLGWVEDAARVHARGEEAVQLSLADADVWAFTLSVRASVTSASPPRVCELRVNGRAQPARLTSPHSLAAELELDPGDNAVQAQCRVAGDMTLLSRVVHLRVPLTAAPRALARLTRSEAAADGAHIALDARGSRPNERTRAPLVRYAWSARKPGQAPVALGEGARLTLPAPDPAQPMIYELSVWDARGRRDRARVTTADLQAEAAQTIVYGVLPPVYGQPPLSATTRALPEIAALGVDTLWLAPVFAHPPDDYGYAVRDFFAVRSDYGSEADLHALIERAHELGLRVLFDLPANHTARAHPYFEQTEALGRRSHYFDYYVRDAAGQPTHYFDWVHLPNLDYRNPEVPRFMTSAGQHWVIHFAVDGYRLDAAWGPRQRNPEFWPHFAAELRRSQPQLMLIAEASARDPYYRRDLFAAAYDWTDQLGQASWAAVWSPPAGVAKRLSDTLPDVSEAQAEARPRVLRFLNNNDTGARFITRHGADLTRVATAALLSLPGIPCLYSLDEVGGAFEPYGLTGAAPPRTEPSLREFHRRFIALRRELPALTGDGYERVYAGTRDELFAYLRYSGSHTALVVLNFSPKASLLRAPLPARWTAPAARDAFSQLTYLLSRRELRVRVKAYATHVFVPDTGALTPHSRPQPH